MKRGQRNLETRPEAARRGKPRSKIEARLRQRRDKFEKIEKTSNFSLGIAGRKRDSERCSGSSITSTSENEISPVFSSSKQRVELVNFETEKFAVPRFRKPTETGVEKTEAIETNENDCRTIVKKEENEKDPTRALKTVLREEMFYSKIEKRNPRNESFYGNPSTIIDRKIVEDDDDPSKQKRRSRSAPCGDPLFKIKCAKDKCPRNLFVERKSLLREKKMTKENRECKKNCIRGLSRISRSGEVAVTSLGEQPRVRRDESRRRDEFQTILKLQQENIEWSFVKKNTKPVEYEGIVEACSSVESSLHSGNTQSFKRELDIDSTSNLTNGQLPIRQRSIESSYSNLENLRPINRKDIEEALKQLKKYVETVSLRENTRVVHRDEDAESSSKNRDSLENVDIESCSNPKNMQSLQRRDGESVNLLRDAEPSSDPKNMLTPEKATESSSNLSNGQSLRREDVESSADRKNTKSLRQPLEADIGSIFRPEAESEIESKEEKMKSHVSHNSDSKEQVPKVETADKAREERNFVSRERDKEDISRVGESPLSRRNEPDERRSPRRKPPNKRVFKWETILEKQHRQSASRSPENRKEFSSDISTKIMGDKRFDFSAEKDTDVDCSKHLRRCPRSRVKSFEERKLVAYSAIREELPKIFMKRRSMDPATINPMQKSSVSLKIEATKTKNWQENLRSSPEISRRESMNRDVSRLNQRFVENFSKRRAARRDCYSMLADSSKHPDSPFGEKISKNIEDSAGRDSEKNERIVEDSGFRCVSNLHRRRNLSKKNKITSDSTSSPRNFQGSIGTKDIFRTSLPRRGESPSPRRVTFRLPGRVVEENSEDEEDNVRHGRRLCEKLNTEEWSGKNNHSERRTEINYNIEHERSPFVGDYEFREHDGISNSCVEEKSPKLLSSNALSVNRMKNLQNVRWASPSCLAGADEPDGRGESDDSEQDWQTPTGEDVYRTVEVTYPKETRQAMRILMRAERNAPGCKYTDLCQKKIGRFDVLRQRKDYPRAEKSPERNSTLLSSYANALAKFQEACCLDGNRRLCGPLSQRRGPTRKPNAAGEIVEKSRDEWRIIGRKNSRPIGDDSINFVHVQSGKLRDNFGGRNTERTMQSNGSESGNSENGIDRTGWTVGLINGKFKYLTAETFGFKINANGASLKKKQLWTLEGSEHQVFLRSHLDRYLAVDQFGNVTCEAEDPSDPGCAFQIQLASDGSGRWALKNVQRGYFLGSSQDELKCMAKAPGEAEYWLVHLAARPQVNLRSAGRKRFAHLSASQDEIHVDAPVPWGEDTLFTLEFRAAATADNDAGGPGHGHGGKAEGGHYALHTCNNKYLARDGKLLDSCTRECLYAAEFHAGLLALRDIHGAYLAPIGSKAVLKSRSTTVTRDELFSLEESLPQASFVAALNQRYVSVKQGVDVTANQDEISGHETFQLEFDRVTKRWYVRTMQDRYWSLEAGGGIQASDHKRSSNALFDLAWQPEDGTVALRANNGKFLATKRSGHLYANADSPDGGDSDVSKYYFYLMNRPILVLRCEQGFVGPKSAASPKLECNKAGYETIRVERCERGVVRFKGQNGKYWHADSEGVTVDSDLPAEGFYLELREPSRLCIKCTDGRYLTAGKNGALRLGETDHDSATKWEF